MQDLIIIPVSAGELFDKITILEIKETKINDIAKRNNIVKELDELKEHSSKLFPYLDITIIDLIQELKIVNAILWKIEDDIRDHERNSNFNGTFIELARSVYIENDRRAKLKKSINIGLQSALIEEKSYSDY